MKNKIDEKWLTLTCAVCGKKKHKLTSSHVRVKNSIAKAREIFPHPFGREPLCFDEMPEWAQYTTYESLYYCEDCGPIPDFSKKYIPPQGWNDGDGMQDIGF